LRARRSSGFWAALPDLPGPLAPVPFTVTSFSTAVTWPYRTYFSTSRVSPPNPARETRCAAFSASQTTMVVLLRANDRGGGVVGGPGWRGDGRRSDPDGPGVPKRAVRRQDFFAIGAGRLTERGACGLSAHRMAR